MSKSAPVTKAKRCFKLDPLAPKPASKAYRNPSTVLREASVLSVAPVASGAGDVSRAKGFDIGDHVQGWLALTLSFDVVVVVIQLSLLWFFL